MVVGLSMLSSNQYISGLFEAGAQGYVPKDGAFEELTTANNSVLKGQMYLSPIVSRNILTDYVTRVSACKPKTNLELSDREKEILQLIAEGKGSKEISNRLHISINTIIRHRQNIMDKLELHSVAELTRYAIREGLIQA
jgi:two-component system response regulator NreC